MKWIPKPRPHDLDTRMKSGFLFFPKTIGEETRWFEFASWLEEYHVGGNGRNEVRTYWREKQWLK